jgi:hypothetical protein
MAQWPTVFMWSRTASAVGLRISLTIFPVGEEHDAVGVACGVRVVGDHHDGLAEVVDGSAHEGEDLVAGGRVEVPGRFVGEHDPGLAGQRPRHSDALLLAAREFTRTVVETIRQADGLHDGVEPLLVRLLAGEALRERDVLACRQCRDQVERLEDEAELVATQLRAPLLVHRGDIVAVDEHLARRECVEAGHVVHQRRLPGPRRAHDRRELAVDESDVDAVERADFAVAGAVVLVCADSSGSERDAVGNGRLGSEDPRRWGGGSSEFGHGNERAGRTSNTLKVRSKLEQTLVAARWITPSTRGDPYRVLSTRFSAFFEVG